MRVSSDMEGVSPPSGLRPRLSPFPPGKPKASRAKPRTLFHYEKGLIWGYKNYDHNWKSADDLIRVG